MYAQGQYSNSTDHFDPRCCISFVYLLPQHLEQDLEGCTRPFGSVSESRCQVRLQSDSCTDRKPVSTSLPAALLQAQPQGPAATDLE